jgi:hypothetical protein
MQVSIGEEKTDGALLTRRPRHRLCFYRGAKFEHVTRLAEFGSMKYSTHRTNAIDRCSDPPCEVSDNKVNIAHG